MQGRTLFTVLSIAFALSLGVVVFAARAVLKAQAVQSGAALSGTLPELGPIPPFSYLDQDKNPVTPQVLRGTPFIANFIFTQCRTVCPLLSAKMVQLQRELPDSGLAFVSFSVDPLHDTPDVLKAYAGRWNPTERRWHLLATTEQTLPDVARKFFVTVEASADPDSPVLHSSVFVLVDKAGVIRGHYDAERRDELEALMRDARKLTGASAPTAALPQDGLGLYHALSCASCHERPELAPSLRGIAGKQRQLDNGASVTADAAYVSESVLQPDAKRVRGYPLHMPSYDGLVDAASLKTLVSWVLEQPAESTRNDSGLGLQTDPVCHMAVRVVADTPSVTQDGKRYVFCSSACAERFKKNPDAFVAPLAQ